MPAPDLDIMFRVLSGQMTLDEIRRIDNQSTFTAAAVAYIWLHRTEYLNEDNHLLRPYRGVLREISQGKWQEDHLVIASQRLGLHQSVSSMESKVKISTSRIIVITLPAGLIATQPDAERARRLMAMIAQEPPAVRHALLEMLKRRAGE